MEEDFNYPQALKNQLIPEDYHSLLWYYHHLNCNHLSPAKMKANVRKYKLKIPIDSESTRLIKECPKFVQWLIVS